jgi:Flp pilus assembly protein TadD
MPVKPSAARRKKDRKSEQPRPEASVVPVRRFDRRHLVVAVALCALTLLAYSNCFQSGFVLDNRGLLLDPRVREATTENLSLIFHHTYWWPTGEAGLYRPLTTLSYLLNYAILGDGDRPSGYHAVNLILHLGNVLFVYALALRLIRKFWPSVFIAAIWAVHPALTESVTNIVGRADLIAGLAVFSGFLMYLRSTEAKTTRVRLFWLAGLTGATAVGVFSKESAIAILPLIVLYELIWWKERGAWRALAFGFTAALVPVSVMLYQRAAVLAASPPAEFPFADNPIVGAGWLTARLTAVKVMADYLWLTVWPAKLSCDYSYNQISLFRGATPEWFACFAVLVVAGLVILLYRWNRTCCFLACFGFLNFVPASNLIFPIGTIMADRLLYIPSFGLVACGVVAIYSGLSERRVGATGPMVLAAAACIVAAGFAIRTWLRNTDWQTELKLAGADVRVSPNSFKLHRLLATSWFDSDRTHANIDRVIEEQEKSLAILDPVLPAQSVPDVYRQAGYYYLLKGDQLHEKSIDQSKTIYEKARQVLLRAISINQARRGWYLTSSAGRPFRGSEEDPQAYLLLSLICLRLGDPNPAYAAISRARALDPLNPQIYRQLAAVLDQQGRTGEADLASMQDHAITSLQEGKWQDTADLTRRVVQIRPEEYPSAYTLNAMANLRLGNLDVAEKSVRQAMLLDSAHRYPRNSYVLALILAQKRDFAASIGLMNDYLNAVPDDLDARKQLGEIDRQTKLR